MRPKPLNVAASAVIAMLLTGMNVLSSNPLWLRIVCQTMLLAGVSTMVYDKYRQDSRPHQD
jgi:hypothetical protein